MGARPGITCALAPVASPAVNTQTTKMGNRVTLNAPRELNLRGILPLNCLYASQKSSVKKPVSHREIESGRHFERLLKGRSFQPPYRLVYNPFYVFPAAQ